MSYLELFMEEQEERKVEEIEEVEDVEYIELPTEHVKDKKIKQKIEKMNKSIPGSTKLRNMEVDLGLTESRLERSQTCKLLIKKLEILVPIYEEDERKRKEKRKKRMKKR